MSYVVFGGSPSALLTEIGGGYIALSVFLYAAYINFPPYRALVCKSLVTAKVKQKMFFFALMSFIHFLSCIALRKNPCTLLTGKVA